MDLPPDFEPRSDALKTLIGRGYLDSASDIRAIDEALADGMVTFYVGFDPTADSVHAGTMLQIMVMRVLQTHGHRPIVIVGGGTALVGDPSGKNETRKILDAQTIAANAKALRAQFERFLHFDSGQANDALMLDNASWLSKLNYVEFLRDIGIHFTVNRMVATKTYRDRLTNEQPLSFLEFNYQLLQAYDYLHLNETYDARLQCGGSDQWGNIIAGVELIRRHRGSDHPAHGLTVPLLTTADGKKMGKTERGAVWLDAHKLSPFDFYQYWIGCDDRDVNKLLRLYTALPLSDIAELAGHEGAALRPAKCRLALEVTKLVHGEEAAAGAQRASEQAFGGGDDWSAVPAIEVSQDAVRLLDIVVDERVGAFVSKRAARQRIEGGAVKIDGEACTDPMTLLERGAAGQRDIRVQAGKRHRFRVVFT